MKVQIVTENHCGRCLRTYLGQPGQHDGCDPVLRVSDLRVIADQMTALVNYLAAPAPAGGTDA